jgi:DNA-binding NarL/FixJ family response regulator
MEKIKILLADDHQMFLDGLCSLLMQLPDVQIVASVTNGKQLLDILGKDVADLVIVDMHMPVMNGLEITKVIKEKHPDVKILCLTMDNDMDSIKNMLEAGASGYILKNTGKAELELAIHQVFNGGNYLSQTVSNQIANNLLLKRKPAVDEAEDMNMLTEREIEIIKLIALENSNSEIAEMLYISPKTVETHRKNLMKKIGAKNSLGIFKFALKHKLI